MFCYHSPSKWSALLMRAVLTDLWHCSLYCSFPCAALSLSSSILIGNPFRVCIWPCTHDNMNKQKAQRNRWLICRLLESPPYHSRNGVWLWPQTQRLLREVWGSPSVWSSGPQARPQQGSPVALLCSLCWAPRCTTTVLCRNGIAPRVKSTNDWKKN